MSELDKLAANVRKAQHVTSDDERDELANSEVAGILAAGIRSQTQLLYAMAINILGIKDKHRAREIFAKTQLVAVDLIMRAYAAGYRDATDAKKDS